MLITTVKCTSDSVPKTPFAASEVSEAISEITFTAFEVPDTIFETPFFTSEVSDAVSEIPFAASEASDMIYKTSEMEKTTPIFQIH